MEQLNKEKQKNLFALKEDKNSAQNNLYNIFKNNEFSADNKKQSYGNKKLEYIQNKKQMIDNMKSIEERKNYFSKDKAQQMFQSLKSFKKSLNQLRNKLISRNDYQKLTCLSDKSIEYLQNIDEEILQADIKNIYKLMSGIHSSVKHEKELEQIGNIVIKQYQIEKLDINYGQNIEWLKLHKFLVPDLTCFSLYNHLQRKEWKLAAYKIDHLRRKRKQVEFYITLIKNKILDIKQKENREVKHIVDFAGGRGDLAFIIAYFFPQIKVTLIDLKAMTINQAKFKNKFLKLNNMNIIEGDISQFKEEFDFGVGLHACGGLTEIILDKCLQQKKFPNLILCTCCFGKIQTFSKLFEYPRSDEYKNKIERYEYFQICNYAECEILKNQDFKHESIFQNIIRKSEQQIKDFNFQNNDDENLQGKDDQIQNQTQSVLKNIQVDEQCFENFKEIRKQLTVNCKYFVNFDRIQYLIQKVNEKQQQYNNNNQQLININPKLVELPEKITPKNQMIII